VAPPKSKQGSALLGFALAHPDWLTSGQTECPKLCPIFVASLFTNCETDELVITSVFANSTRTPVEVAPPVNLLPSTPHHPLRSRRSIHQSIAIAPQCARRQRSYCSLCMYCPSVVVRQGAAQCVSTYVCVYCAFGVAFIY
jgi:hypothetical protein